MLRVVTAAAEMPVSLAEAKAHLRAADFQDDDDYIVGLINAATLHAEFRMQRCFVTRTLELVRPDWCDMRIPVAPVAIDGIVSVKYVDGFGVQQTLAASGYVARANGPSVCLIPAAGLVWPYLDPFAAEPVVVRFIAGAGAADVGENVKQAIKLYVGHWYANREHVVVDSSVAALKVPEAADALLLAEAW